MDDYVHEVYRVTKRFPKTELFAVTSQIKRSALSVVLNYIEGYARSRHAVHKNFLEISYGSLKETQYLIGFSFKENYLLKEEYESLYGLGDKIGAMLWSTLIRLKK